MRVLLLLLFIPSLVHAQQPASPQQYAKTITAADLKEHLYIVAGKEMEGRETATEGERRAAAYISEYFKRQGLQPGNKGSYLMPFPLYRDSLVGMTLKVNEQSYEAGKDFRAGGHTISLNFNNAVYIGSVDRDSLKNNSTLFGRLVISNKMDAIYAALSFGASGALYIDERFKPATVIPTGSLRNNKYGPYNLPPIFSISEQVARDIIGKAFDSVKLAGNNKGFVPKIFHADIEMSVTNEAKETFANNVLGVIEGTDKKDEYLFITAHYDHEGKRSNGDIYYGADDDGSGTVTILELAQAFAKAKAEGRGPRRTIVFMTVSGEEKGLWGSAYYSNHPIFPLEKTTADLNIDMVGRIDPNYKGDSLNYIYSIGDNKLSSDLPVILDKVNKKYTKLQIDRKFNDPKDPNGFYYRSDHYNFANKGVPIIFFFNGVHADYHKPTDTPDKINYPLMEKRARLIFHTAWEMANRDQLLKRDIPLQ